MKGLAPRDAGFARALASQTLRHLGALDAVLRKFLQKPLAPHKAGAASEILLLGACELLILKVAPHAAVDAANQLAAKDSKAVHFKPLINAVLRRVAGKAKRVLSGLDRERLSTPDWLWTRWAAQYGQDTARAIARAHQQEAPLDIVLKSPARHPAQRSTVRSSAPAELPKAASRTCPASRTAIGGCRTPPPPCPRCCWAMSRASA